MKVLLVSANTLMEPYPVYPMGLDYVAAAIGRRHEVKIVDMNVLERKEMLVEVIDDFRPDIIGISLRNVDNTDTSDPRGFIGIYRDLVELIRMHSDASIVLGGSGFTIFPGEIMAALDADYGVIGEGERMALLLDAIEKRRDVAGMPGIVSRKSQPVTAGPWPQKFSRIFPQNTQHAEFYIKKGGMLNLQTKRGCNQKCIYCTYPHIEGARQRLIDPKAVADAARRLEEAGARYFFVTDSTFNSDVRHTLEIARAFVKAGVSIPWGAFFMPMKPPEGYYRALAEAGLSHVEFGTESLSNRMLTTYRKPYRVSDVFKAHQAAVDQGLHVAHYFLLGGPGENPETLNHTLSRIETIKKAVFFFFCGMRIYPHTKLYDMAISEGQLSSDQDILEPVFYHSSSIRADAIIDRVKAQAAGRINWIVGAGGDKTAAIVSRLHARGHTGPLWEYLIR